MKKTLLMMMAVVLVGCCTTDRRGEFGDGWLEVGTYTLDQAVVEFGPPDATSKLSNGGTWRAWALFSGWPRGKSIRKKLKSKNFAAGYFLELHFDKDGVLAGFGDPRLGNAD